MPDEPPVLYLDADIGGKTMREALVAAGARVEVHSQHFPEGTKDIEWLPVVGENGWFALTKDENIGRNALEIEAWRKAGVGLFVFVPKDLTGAAIARIVVASLPAIYRFIEENSPPFIAKIYRDAKVEKWK
jgi:hypothetical protein